MGHYFVGLLNNMCYTGNTDTCYQPIENFALTASSENFLNSTLFGNNFDQNLLDQDLFQNVPSCISTLEEPLPTDDIERYLNAISEISSELELSDYSSPLSSPNSFSSSPLSSPMYSPMPTSPVQNEVVSNLVRTDKAGPQDWTVHLNGEEKTYRETALYHDVQWVPELFYQLFRENHPDPKNEEFYKGTWVKNTNLLFYQMVNGSAILFQQTELNTIPKGGDTIFQKLPYAVKSSNGLLTGMENEVQSLCTITIIPMDQKERELLSLECQKSTKVL